MTLTRMTSELTKLRKLLPSLDSSRVPRGPHSGAIARARFGACEIQSRVYHAAPQVPIDPDRATATERDLATRLEGQPPGRSETPSRSTDNDPA